MFNLEECHSIGHQRVLKVTDSQSGNYFSIFPSFGAALNDLVIDGKEIHRATKNQTDFELNQITAYSGTHLFPFINRLEEGKFEWKGERYKFPLNEPENQNALHGFIYKEEFKVKGFDGNTGVLILSYSYSGQYDYFPFPFEFEVTYQLSVNNFLISAIIKNLGDEVFPYSYGFHPYFRTNKLNDAIIKIPSSMVFEVNDRLIPTGEVAPLKGFSSSSKLEELVVDHCFALSDVDDIQVVLEAEDLTVKVLPDKSMKYFQIYTPEKRDVIAMEPQTSIANSYNNGISVLELKPAETVSFQVSFEISV